MAGVRVAALAHAGLERDELLVQDLLLLLAHRAAQQVGLAERVAGELLRGALHLLLVDDQAVGDAQDLLERLLQLGVDRARSSAGRSCAARSWCASSCPSGPGRYSAMTAEMSSKLSGRIWRSSDRMRAAVELEHAQGVAAAEQLVGRRVVERRPPRSRSAALPFISMFSSASSRIVRLRRPRKSILIRPRASDRRVVELRDDRAVLRAPHDRDDVDQRLARHDDAGRVHAPLPLEVLQPLGGLEHALRLGVGLHAPGGTRRPPRSAGPAGRRCPTARCPCPSPRAASPW